MAIATGTAILGAAAIAGGASLAAGAMQADAAGDAADAQLAGVRESRRQYDLARKDFAPYRETGVNALSELGALYGVGREGLLSPEEIDAARARFQVSPGYQFAFDEGLNALDRSASARGRLLGGGYGRELTRYGQGLASQQFGEYANRLAQLAGVGQSATGSTAAAGSASAGQQMAGYGSYGNALMQAGEARASGYVGASNALNGGVNNLVLYDYLKGKQ